MSVVMAVQSDQAKWHLWESSKAKKNIKTRLTFDEDNLQKAFDLTDHTLFPTTLLTNYIIWELAYYWLTSDLFSGKNPTDV